MAILAARTPADPARNRPRLISARYLGIAFIWASEHLVREHSAGALNGIWVGGLAIIIHTCAFAIARMQAQFARMWIVVMHMSGRPLFCGCFSFCRSSEEHTHFEKATLWLTLQKIPLPLQSICGKETVRSWLPDLDSIELNLNDDASAEQLKCARTCCRRLGAATKTSLMAR